MEIVLKTNEKKLVFSIYGTSGTALVDVYAEDRKGPAYGKPQPLGKVEFADVVRMAKAITGLVPT